MKVYTIYLDGCCGWATENPEDFKTELGEDYDGAIEIFIDNISKMQIGGIQAFCEWEVKCIEMTEDEYNSLPEFSGW